MSETLTRPAGPRWERWLMVGVGVVAVIMVLGGCLAGWMIGTIVGEATTENPRSRDACDRAVRQLLTTHDGVELERARILVSDMRCDVTRRLPH